MKPAFDIRPDGRTVGEARPASPSGRRLRRRALGFGWAMALPLAALLIGLSVYPLVYLLKTSLTSYNMLSLAPTRFVGLQNYANLFQDALFVHALAITGVFALAVVVAQMTVGVGLAVVLRGLGRAAQTVLILLLIPTILSPSVAAFQWVQLFNIQFGPIDFLLHLMGIKPLLWTASAQQALPSLLLVDFWEWTPFIMLLVYAGLQALPDRIFEAAAIDGSSPWQTFWNVTVPLLRPVLGIALILRLIGVFQLWGTVLVLTNGGPGIATETLSFYTYVHAFTYFDVGYAAAMAFVQLIVIVVLVQGIVKLMTKPHVRTLVP
jgi:multiple sugar transport system permease protein